MDKEAETEGDGEKKRDIKREVKGARVAEG